MKASSRTLIAGLVTLSIGVAMTVVLFCATLTRMKIVDGVAAKAGLAVAGAALFVIGFGLMVAGHGDAFAGVEGFSYEEAEAEVPRYDSWEVDMPDGSVEGDESSSSVSSEWDSADAESNSTP